jgi:hypothetical protein
VSHLTAADELPDEQLHRIAVELVQASKGKRPISADAEEVALLDTNRGGWQVRTKFKSGLTLTDPDVTPEARCERSSEASRHGLTETLTPITAATCPAELD